METAQANEWTLMLMRHQTLRRNCENVIMVERKKVGDGSVVCEHARLQVKPYFYRRRFQRGLFFE